jgi:membrane protein implicated in regulation of membrane protease activity
MSYYTIFIIAFIVLVIIRANNTKIGTFTVLWCISLLGSTVTITLIWELPVFFSVIAPIAVLVLAFWIGKKLGNNDTQTKRELKYRRREQTDEEGIMSKRTDEELTKIANEFKISSTFKRMEQHQSSPNNDDLSLTPEDLVNLVNFSAALEELKKRGIFEGEIPPITLNLTSADKDDDSEYVFNKK